MKHDITSRSRILSRKIKALFLRVSIVLFGLAGTSFPALSGSDFEPFITVQQLQSLPLDQRVVIDTRPAWKYLFGHIPGAVNLSDWMKFSTRINGVPGQINQDKNFIVEKMRALGIDGQKTIVVYGDPTDKWRTDGRFFWMFEFYGFTRTALLKGGFQHWERAGFPIHRGLGTNPKPSSLQVSDLHFNRGVLADQQWIAARLGAKDLVLIDNREKHEYQGARPYGSVRGGHIPGAMHIDWREFFKSDGTLKSREELGSLLKSKGIQPRQHIVVYCTGGVRSAMAYFVFRYLGYTVRNYDGSWWDWSHNPELPIES
jgi:thiosulfate/3-mercaptopyruvate sulfurtransferase